MCEELETQPGEIGRKDGEDLNVIEWDMSTTCA